MKRKTVCVSTTLCVGQCAHAGLYACVKSSVICEQVLCVKRYLSKQRTGQENVSGKNCVCKMLFVFSIRQNQSLNFAKSVKFAFELPWVQEIRALLSTSTFHGVWRPCATSVFTIDLQELARELLYCDFRLTYRDLTFAACNFRDPCESVVVCAWQNR